MTGFFWNIRGFNKSVKHGVVRNWVRDQSFLFGCLIETRIKENKAEKIAGEVFNGWSFMGNYEYNRLGRVWVLWRPEVRLTPVYKSAQIITCSILLPGEKEEFFYFVCLCFQYYGGEERVMGRSEKSLGGANIQK